LKQKTVFIFLAVILTLSGIFVTLIGMIAMFFDVSYWLFMVGLFLLFSLVVLWLTYLRVAPDSSRKFSLRRSKRFKTIDNLNQADLVRVIETKEEEKFLKKGTESTFCSKCGLVIDFNIQKCKNCGKSID
jgi:hypothetical protein